MGLQETNTISAVDHAFAAHGVLPRTGERLVVDAMQVTFSGEIWYWRGPAPFHFVTVPVEAGRELKALAALVTYGWGMIPVTARIGATEWKTSLFPKQGGYVVPLKDRVRSAHGLEVGDRVTLQLEVRQAEAGA